MASPLLGQILGSVFSNALRGRTRSGPLGGASGGVGGTGGSGGMGGMGGGLGGAGLGGILGGMLGRGGGALGGTGARRGGGGGMLLAMLLPFAMQWVQRNGGIGAVVDRFRQNGYEKHASSWLSTGDNDDIDAEAVNNVIGRDELSRLAQQLGVPEDEVAQGFAEIMPEMVNQLSPDGDIASDADDALESGRTELERELSQLTTSSLG
jgi:uncharacterized protein YidB (DUF937 family)